ncbi:MAG: YggS family pyridoxal phosphate-dependent enzyme [Solirubrobacteraceae bacterium]|jgi:pyridoxal phosphate enzyme (YggS family)
MNHFYKKLTQNFPLNITLVTVSKTRTNQEIMELYNLGQRDFGENKVQELVNKYQILPKDINWHMIGHLQVNKVKFIAPFVHLIHSIDSLKIAQEINKQAQKENRRINGLLQLKIAEEESKFGLSFIEAEKLMLEIEAMNHLKIVGIMGMATNTTIETKIEKEFLELNEYFNQLKANYSLIKILSMGMSSDYTIAIKCGSNLVRIGSLLF